MEVLYENSKRKRGNDCMIYKSVVVFKDPMDGEIFCRLRDKTSGWRSRDNTYEYSNISGYSDPENITDNLDFPDEWEEDVLSIFSV